MIKKINKDKSGFIEQMDKIDRLLAILRERKREEYMDHFMTNKFHNLGNMNLR